MDTIGAILKQRIKEKGYSQVEFADVCQISVTILKRYMKDELPFSVELLKKFAELLDCSTDYLLGQAETPNREIQTLKEQTHLSDGALLFLEIAQKVGYIRYNPSDSVVLPRVERPAIKPLSDENIAHFLTEIQGHKYEDLFKVTLFTGMREGEALGLTWDCVDLENHTISVEKQLILEKKKGGAYKFAPLKNDKCRVVKIPKTICNIFSRAYFYVYTPKNLFYSS